MEQAEAGTILDDNWKCVSSLLWENLKSRIVEIISETQ